MALFKIFKGKDKTKLDAMPMNDGYAYYNTNNGLFYIDAEYPSENNSNQLVLDRRPINAQRAFYDSHNSTEIYKTYIKGISISNNQLSYTTGDGVSHSVEGTLGAVTGVKGNAEATYRTGQVNLTPADIGAATSGHTHTTTIATDSGTNQLTLAFGTKYKLTAGGTSYIFTMPANPNTNTASAVDNILDGSNSGTAITYAPYTSQQSKLSFDTSTTNPTRTDRLNLNGYLYATKLYSGGKEVLTDVSGKLDKSGGTMTGALKLSADPTDNLHAATKQYVDNAFTTNDALVFKGTLGASGDGATVSSLPDTHKQGWTYKVVTAGTYAGQECEIGDTIYCITDGTTNNNAHWTVVQTNIDGTVIGPSESASGVAVFTGTTGKAIRDSGFTIATSVPANAKFTDTDTKVTSVDNHYTPSANTDSELTASLSETAGSYALNTEYIVLTGVKAQRDAKGHVTGLTYTAQKIKDTNTTYTLAELMGSTTKGSQTKPIYWDGSKFDTITSYEGKATTAGTADKATAANLDTTINAIAKYSSTSGVFANSGVLIDASNNITPSASNTSSIGIQAKPWKSMFINTNPTTNDGLAFSNGSSVLGRIGVTTSGIMVLSVPDGQGIYLRPQLANTDPNVEFIVNKNEVQLLNIPKINLTNNTKSASIVFNSTTNALDFVFA